MVGGDFDAAVSIADIFLDNDEVVKVVDGRGSRKGLSRHLR